ncbi:S41 family peptidase [Mucilaginibacter koreensis]
MKQTAVVIFRVVILLLVGFTIGFIVSNASFSGNNLNLYGNGESKVERVVQLLKNNYVDSVNTDTLETNAIDQMLQSLDPHSLYLPPWQAQSVNERLEGGFTGVGVTYILLRDTLAITKVYPGGPAAKAGLQSGDRILTINRMPLSGRHITLSQVGQLFAGAPNTPITLSVLHWNSKAVQTYVLNRGRVTLTSLDVAYMAAPGTGYIKISKFASTTDADFKGALQELLQQKMQRLILDLRGNGGGYLSAATAISDEFLPKGKLIVYTQGLHEKRTDYLATDSGLFQQGRVVVLIDEHSASSSEIVAGALQDLDRAEIVGRRSFGKGLVQEQFLFNDSSAVNLTVARYYTPSGRSIQKSYKNGTVAYHEELEQRAQTGELYGSKNRYTDSLQHTSSRYRTSGGRQVYSGGGIMPDVFVPEDPSVNNTLVKELKSNQLFTAYAIDRLQPILSKYPSAAAFAAQYQPGDGDLTAFIVYASRTLPEMDSQEIRAAAGYLKQLIKAYAIQLKWGNAAYYQFLNEKDMDVKKAVEVISKT